MSNYYDRMVVEQEELVARVVRLAGMVESDTYDGLPLAERLLLNGQLQGMSMYADYLQLRIELYEEEHT